MLRSDDLDALKREYDDIQRELQVLRAQLEEIKMDVFATRSAVVRSVTVPVKLNKEIAKRLWDRLECEYGVTVVDCAVRGGQIDSYRRLDGFLEMADDGDKEILLVRFRKEASSSTDASPIRVDYDVAGAGRATVSVFGKKSDAISLEDDLVQIVKRGRQGSRWRRYSRWPSCICAILAFYFLWKLGLDFYAANVEEDASNWTVSRIKIAVNAAMLMGMASFALGLGSGWWLSQAIDWLFPMVTIELGRGIELDERRRRIRWWVIGTPLAALVALVVRSIF